MIRSPKGAALTIVEGIVVAKGERGAEIVFDSDASTPAAKDHARFGPHPASLLVHAASKVSIGTCTLRNDGVAGIRLQSS